MNHEIAGRKVFILNPPTVVTHELVEALLAAEYEVYLLKDREPALRVLRKFPDSVLFINIDRGAKDHVWEIYVRNMINDPVLNTVRIGILSYNPSPELLEKYLIDLGVHCGFVRLKLGVPESTRIMLAALRANEAKGRRKYVRVQAGEDPQSGFTVLFAGQIREGTILDISSVGMAARFDSSVDIPANSKLPEMQLRLRSTIVRVTAIVLSRREDDKSVYVLLFEYGAESRARHQIRMYIHKRLQEEVNTISGEHQ